jgi:hypothetical protein
MLRGDIHLYIRRRAPGARDVVADGGNESGEAGHDGDCSWRCQQPAIWGRRRVARQRRSQTEGNKQKCLHTGVVRVELIRMAECLRELSSWFTARLHWRRWILPSNGRSGICNRTPATVTWLNKLLLARESAKHNCVQFSFVNLSLCLFVTTWQLHPAMYRHPVLTTSSPFPLIISFHTLMIYSLSAGLDCRKANARRSFQIHILTSSLFDECTFSALGPTLVGFRSRKSFVDGTLEPPKNDR